MYKDLLYTSTSTDEEPSRPPYVRRTAFSLLAIAPLTAGHAWKCNAESGDRFRLFCAPSVAAKHADHQEQSQNTGRLLNPAMTLGSSAAVSSVTAVLPHNSNG